MIEKVCEFPEIYKIPIELKGNALKVLNAYLVKSKEQYLLIDTGFNNEECKRSLLEGLKEFGLTPSDVSVFLTHLHADHTGLAELFADSHLPIYMGKNDYEYLNYTLCGDYEQKINEIYLREGFPEKELKEQREDNPAMVYTVHHMFHASLLKNGDTFTIGNITFECVEVPGHTPGHMCLYIREQEIMFLGDHVLYDITPNVMEWPNVTNSLGKYLDSLSRIKAYPVKLALPAHRGKNREISLEKRIDDLIIHHEKRLEEVREILREKGKLNSYQIASRMRWSLRQRNWLTAPKQQKWFAMGEARAHIMYLLALGEVVKEDNGKEVTYRLIER